MFLLLVMLVGCYDCGPNNGRQTFSSDRREDVERWAHHACVDGDWRREGGVYVTWDTRRVEGREILTARYNQVVVRCGVIARGRVRYTSGAA